jgi:hypothetical protein
VLFDASLGFGEGYMNGDIEVEGDLRQVVRIGLLCDGLLERTKHSLFNIFKLNVLQTNATSHAITTLETISISCGSIRRWSIHVLTLKTKEIP